MSENITLTQPILGMNPYVLIEALPDPDDEDGFKLSIRSGGGTSDKDEILMLLLTAVEAITGVDPDLYVQQIDAVRRAAGLSPLLGGDGA